jgi:hypothetical protein
MARARNIKPSFFANEDLAECSPLARLLFVGLWTLADREGRLEYRPRRIKGQLFPFEDCNIDKLVCELERHDFVRFYSAGACLAIWLPTFSKHQKPHHNEQDSDLPPWSKALATKVTTACDQIALNEESLTTDSLILNPDSAATPPTSEVPADETLPAPEGTPRTTRPRKAAEIAPELILLPPELDTPAFRAARDAWFAQRRRRRLSLRVEHIERSYERLRPLGPTGAAACLQSTIDNDYDGIFPEKFGGKKPKFAAAKFDPNQSAETTGDPTYGRM